MQREEIHHSCIVQCSGTKTRFCCPVRAVTLRPHCELTRREIVPFRQNYGFIFCLFTASGTCQSSEHQSTLVTTGRGTLGVSLLRCTRVDKRTSIPQELSRALLLEITSALATAALTYLSMYIINFASWAMKGTNTDASFIPSFMSRCAGGSSA